MGVATGSGGILADGLIKILKEGGFEGESITDKRVHIIKTHSPERSGKNKFPAERAILLVRNPLDALFSQFNMVATQTHNLSIQEKDWPKLIPVFKGFIEQEITVWSDFH